MTAVLNERRKTVWQNLLFGKVFRYCKLQNNYNLFSRNVTRYWYKYVNIIIIFLIIHLSLRLGIFLIQTTLSTCQVFPDFLNTCLNFKASIPVGLDRVIQQIK